MSQAVRNRQNRTDKTQRFSQVVCGAVIQATAYNDDIRMFDVHSIGAASPAVYGEMADGLLPVDDEN